MEQRKQRRNFISCSIYMDIKKENKDQSVHLIISFQKMETNAKLTHFCHRHQLSKIPTAADDAQPICVACVQPILSGSLYTCAGCQFHIHDSCLHQMPDKVEHYFHWTHLLLPDPLLPHESEQCDACLGEIKGVTFRCDYGSCIFNLHASCTQFPLRSLRHKCHFQDLYYFPPKFCPRSATCTICGENCNDSFFRSVWSNDANFHLECIPVPKIHNQVELHEHPLKLVDSFTKTGSSEHKCFVCGVKCEEKHSVYCCEECSSCIAHIECIASEVKFEHFSHEDDLSFIEDAISRRCNCCLLLIHGSAYACIGCDFWLHKSCFELPVELSNLHSEHSCKLVSSDYSSLIFRCDECENIFSGFRYNCHQCGLNFDLDCALKKERPGGKDLERNVICHFAHEHELILSSCEKLGDVAGETFLDQLRCRKCLRAVKGLVYACTECGFYLHETCNDEIVKAIPHHPLHDLHPLLGKDSEDERCNDCNQIFTGITYKCERCHFNLDVSCAYSTM